MGRYVSFVLLLFRLGLLLVVCYVSSVISKCVVHIKADFHSGKQALDRIGLDSFLSCIIRTAGPKKLKTLQLFIIGS